MNKEEIIKKVEEMTKGHDSLGFSRYYCLPVNFRTRVAARFQKKYGYRTHFKYLIDFFEKMSMDEYFNFLDRTT